MSQDMESVELAVEFMKSRTPQRIRLSFILLHNVSELLMHSMIETWIFEDEFFSRLRPPQFSKLNTAS